MSAIPTWAEYGLGVLPGLAMGIGLGMSITRRRLNPDQSRLIAFLEERVERLTRERNLTPKEPKEILTYQITLDDGTMIEAETDCGIKNFNIEGKGDSLWFTVRGKTMSIIPEVNVKLVMVKEPAKPQVRRITT